MARLHAFALQRVSTPHAVVGVHDRDHGAATEFAREFGGQAFESAATMLAETRPNIVHVCTPAGTHFEPARTALLAGAHVYVEKPFQETAAAAQEILSLAAAAGLQVCAGHQQLHDRAYAELLGRAGSLGQARQVESRFTFAPPFDATAAPPERVAHQLLDILPHPLYTLLHAMERLSEGSTRLEHLSADVAEVHAILRRGQVMGTLHVSLVARPIVSSLTVTGTGGSLTADFVRSVLVGAGNPGTSPVEKILNPLVEGLQLQWRSMRALATRLFAGGHYPGLAEMLGAFYQGIATGQASPVSRQHLSDVTAVFESIARAVTAARPTVAAMSLASPRGPLAVVTGAGGFFGQRIAAALAARGYRVRGVARSADTRLRDVHEWVTADLSRPVPSAALAGADIVVHAAAATSGGQSAHQRHSVDATRHLLEAMAANHVRRLVYISSISVLEPPSSPWEIQTEATPLAARAEALGPYTWGKTEAERLVRDLGPQLGIATRILRPAALVDLATPDMPGLLGRRLYGRWHLGLGRPGLPFALCDVGLAGRVVAWVASHFDGAPPVVNLWDPAYPRRRDVIRAFRERGWDGLVVWVPILLLGVAAQSARWAMALLRGSRPRRLSIIGVLKARRFDPTVSRDMLARVAGPDTVPAVQPAPHTLAVGTVSGSP